MGLTHHIRIVLLAVFAASSVQCVRDSLDGCEYGSGLIIQLAYVDHNGNNILPETMTEAGVYIFDMEDRLVAGYHMEHSILHSSAKAEFDLPPGDYYALAWGNRPFTERPGEPTIMAGDLYVPMNKGEKYYYAPGQSFKDTDFSYLKVTVPHRGKVTHTIDFMPVYISFDVWIYGLDDEVGGVNLPPTVEMGNIPDGFDFFLKETLGRDNRVASSQYTLSPDGEKAAYARFVLPYFYPGADNNLRIYIASDGTQVLAVNLLDFVMENELPAQPGDSIEIYIRFSGSVLVEVGVPGWSNTPVVPEV